MLLPAVSVWHFYRRFRCIFHWSQRWWSTEKTAIDPMSDQDLRLLLPVKCAFAGMSERDWLKIRFLSF